MKNLDKRKALASKVLGVGKGRIRFDVDRLADIKEAITKQDIKDLYSAGVITLREVKGRRTKIKRKTRVGPGKIKKKVKKRKQEYVRRVRKQRRYLKEIKKQEGVTREQYIQLRKMIKAKSFKNKAHLKEHMAEVNKK